MILDTSAWVEFLIGSEKGSRVKEELIKGVCYTSIVTLAELSSWSLREGQEAYKVINTIKSLSNVIGLDEDTAVLSGKLNFKRKKENRKWGMLDSMILATAMMYDLDILTCDNDFRDVSIARVI